MNDKTLRHLKSHWPKVLDQGGYFAVALQDWPKQEDAVPYFLVHKSKEVTKAAIKKMDKDVDVSKKLIVGRITIEDRVAFNISPDSRTRSPALLGKAIRRLAEEEELAKLRLQRVKKAHFRLDQDLELQGDQRLDTAESTRASAKGRGIKDKKIKIGKSSFDDLMKQLSQWHKTFWSEVNAVRDGKTDSPLFTAEDEDDLFTQDEHWGDVKMRVQGLANALLSESDYRGLKQISDLDAVLSGLAEEHARFFDPHVHNVLPQKIDDRVDAELRGLFERAERLLRDEAYKAVQRLGSTVFAIA